MLPLSHWPPMPAPLSTVQENDSGLSMFATRLARIGGAGITTPVISIKYDAVLK
jgi:hypothetical protein